MIIKIIGARALNPIEDKKVKKHASAIFYHQNKSLQIDIGNKSTQAVDYLVITHLHSDHVGQIKTVSAKTKILAPHKSFQEFIGLKIKRPVRLFKSQKFLKLNDFEILAFKVNHSKHTKAFGYLVKSENKTCLWLPDFRNLDGCLKYFKNLDALFIGASTFSRPINSHGNRHYGHLDIITTLKVLKQNKLQPKRIYLMHLGRRLPPVPEKVAQLKLMFPKFKIEAVFDGQTIKI